MLWGLLQKRNSLAKAIGEIMSDIIKDELKERIKQHEGYRLDTYIDTLGFKTGGYGHKMLPGEEPPKDKRGVGYNI